MILDTLKSSPGLDLTVMSPCPSCRQGGIDLSGFHFKYKVLESKFQKDKTFLFQCEHVDHSVEFADVVPKYTEPPDLFLSYNWGIEDKTTKLFDNQEVVKVIRDAIEYKGQIKCWMDLGQMGKGDNLTLAMKSGIANAKIALIFLSPLYAASENCRREFNWIRDMNKPVICVVMHTYALANCASRWGTADDNTDGGLWKEMSDEQKQVLLCSKTNFIYFDFSTTELRSSQMSELVNKIKEVARSTKTSIV